MNLKQISDSLFDRFLSDRVKDKIELVIIMIAIASFLVHLIVIGLVDSKIIELDGFSKLLTNPIAAIYTPFSFILIYEVYLLIYYLPKSITVYIGKQYEIMTLILIRRIFKDLSALEFTPDWFKVRSDLIFTFDIIATLILFFLIWIFYSLNPRREGIPEVTRALSPRMTQFIQIKNVIAILLVPIFFGIAAYSLVQWVYENFVLATHSVETITNINSIFFDRFFMVLVMVDVLLLLVSFLRTDQFSKVIRNSGFVISTILIKISFGTEGFMNTVLIVTAVLFGVTILAIHNLYDRLEKPV
jgi:hypothetical protein